MLAQVVRKLTAIGAIDRCQQRQVKMAWVRASLLEPGPEVLLDATTVRPSNAGKEYSTPGRLEDVVY